MKDWLKAFRKLGVIGRYCEANAKESIEIAKSMEATISEWRAELDALKKRQSKLEDYSIDDTKKISQLRAKLEALEAKVESNESARLKRAGNTERDILNTHKEFSNRLDRHEDMIDNNTDSIEDIRELLAGDNTISENMAKAMAGALATFEQRLEKLERQKAQADDLQRRMEELD